MREPRRQPDRLGASSWWRFDLVPRAPSGPVERVSLWFDRRDARLLRSRAVLSDPEGPGRAGPFVVTTDYARVDRLDLPTRRVADGTVRTRRRGRVFTVVVDGTSRFAAHRVER